MSHLAFPPLLVRLHEIEFDYEDGNGIGFEPFSAFLSEEETQAWFKAWTGNSEACASQYRVFGQDGTGGYAAFWIVRDEVDDILRQPVVFFGSEGEMGVVASDFFDYLWLLAGRYGPFEAVSYPIEQRAPQPEFTVFAQAYAPERRKSVAEVITTSRAEFPAFVSDVERICGY